MNILIQKASNLPQQKNLDLLIIPLADKKLPKSLLAQKNLPLEEIKHNVSQGDLKNKKGSQILFYPSGSFPAKRVLLVEVGSGKTPSAQLAEAFKDVWQQVSRAKTVGVILTAGNERVLAHSFLVSLYRSLYEFNFHKSKIEEDDKLKLENLIVFSDADIKKTVARAQAIGDALGLVRTLANHPANVMTPKKLAADAIAEGKINGFAVKVIGEKEMEKLGMGGILGISRGSDEEAQLILLDYNPKGKKTISLVGKGITFDSGGISIKPSKDMHEMKFDMAGGATVLALVELASRLKLPYRIVGAIAATENLPSGKAIKPGDVVKTYSGKTVEVLNTDAEGRMVLSDALAYVQKNYRPNLIVDLATLTGAIVIALGNKITGAFGNNEKFNRQLSAAAQTSGEPLHFMPLFPKYKEDLKSRVADLANIGKQRVDATIAGLFLQEFIEKNTPWIHLDIAGTAWDNDGATGVMVTTLLEFMEQLKF